MRSDFLTALKALNAGAHFDAYVYVELINLFGDLSEDELEKFARSRGFKYGWNSELKVLLENMAENYGLVIQKPQVKTLAHEEITSELSVHLANDPSAKLQKLVGLNSLK